MRFSDPGSWVTGRLIPLALAFLLLASGCAATNDPPLAGVREEGQLILTRPDNSRTAEIKVGQQIAVRLPENPTTGFGWAVDETSRQLLTLDRTEYTGPTETYVGVKGLRSFTFTAKQAGEVTLKLKYWRFWEGDASVTERYAVTLKIRD
jgi:inhibitor of cysteine peptidase